MPWINPKIKPGERRKVLTGIPGKTGIIYTLDRKTGEFLWATPTVQQNVVSDDRRRHRRGDHEPGHGVHRHATSRSTSVPAFTGGKNWTEGAYSPKTNVMYMPLQNICSVVTSAGPKTKGQIGMGINYTRRDCRRAMTNVGTVYAIYAATGRTAGSSTSARG